MDNISLESCDFKKLLPLWMREDATDASLAEFIDEVVKDLMERTKTMSKWGWTDYMTEEQLDKMAWEQNIVWYKYDASIKQKRDIVKNALKIHRKLGTKWAIEQVLTIYFSDAKILEWFEYGGIPGHFKIRTFNTETVDTDAEKFLKILNEVKRAGQVLDEIEVLSSSSMSVEYVITPRTVDKVVTIMKE